MRKFIHASVLLLLIVAPAFAVAQEVPQTQMTVTPMSNEAGPPVAASSVTPGATASTPVTSTQVSGATESSVVQPAQVLAAPTMGGETQPVPTRTALPTSANSAVPVASLAESDALVNVDADALPTGALTLGLAFSALQRADDGLEIFEGPGVTPQFVLLAGYDTPIAGALRLGGEMSWGIAAASNGDYFGGELAAEALEHRALLSAVLALPLHPRIWPHLRFGGGLSAMKVHIDRDATQTGVDDWLMAPMAEVAAGATFQWPVGRYDETSARATRLGVRIEGGYALSKNSDVRLAGSADGAIPTQFANLGSIHTGGALLRIGLVLRF